MSRILVVDDEPHIRDVICFAIERAGMTTVVARNGAEAMMAFRRGNIDLAILDIGMPEIDGLEVCRRIRAESALPILFLSARDDEIDRVVGFEIGGDDYVTKPFSPRELVARVKAILKRASGIAIGQQPCLTQGPIRLDRDSRSVTSDGMEVGLTAVEFAILATILARPNTVFTREQLMGAAYGAGIHVADRTIDSHVRNIRAKFADAGCTSVIATVHGVGFKLAPALGT
ncbi:two-component system OmpR family response regulator [Sinorhizobium fredii]|uniref:Transcriptional regulatory protein ResD n=1 Tax=Sinorhizobium fredii (strain USDA 257) TaxID=1185652 RepID=I3X5S9_SINF2|nr:response regulator [Sinorhizobium fredii]AFL51235.1 transcriptional regulatory protein ResD [Sinorhizobium fredii USDA 257]